MAAAMAGGKSKKKVRAAPRVLKKKTSAFPNILCSHAIPVVEHNAATYTRLCLSSRSGTRTRTVTRTRTRYSSRRSSTNVSWLRFRRYEQMLSTPPPAYCKHSCKAAGAVTHNVAILWYWQMKLITPSALVERLKINASLARAAIKELENDDKVKKVAVHHQQWIYTRVTKV
jgi:hypothetical protein